MLDIEQKKLAEYMSELSQRAYYATWMADLEYDLWNVLETDQKKYGRLNISDNECAKLKELSEKCNGWIILDEDDNEKFIEIGEWEKIYIEKVLNK